MSETNDRRRKGEIMRSLKKIEAAMVRDKEGKTSVDNIELLPLPPIKPKIAELEIKKKRDVKKLIKKEEGNWPQHFIYNWELQSEIPTVKF